MRFCVFLLLWAFVSCVGAKTTVWQMPQIQPRHLYLQGILINAVRAGRIEEMERVSREGVALLPEDPTWRYNLACALAYRADKTEAFQVLEKAIELGFNDRKAIQNDNDLKQLAGDPRFARLLDKADALRATPRTQDATVEMFFMGLPAKISSSNTVWNFDGSCFQSLITLRKPDISKISASAEMYNGPAKEKICAWMREDLASGNFGDLYVNRDAGHSSLDTSVFPGLTPVVYSEEAKAAHADIGTANMFFSRPVIGNASLAMPEGPFWRSIPRAIACTPLQLQVAGQLFFNNQSWFYPAHKDFTPENGDVFTVNLPFLTVSKGSSFSDLPFLRAFAAMLAAFTPEMKRQLVMRKALASTMQVILRATQKNARFPDGYFSAEAHPVVFDAANLDEDAMVEMAHSLRPQDIPPLVFLHIDEEKQAEEGRDFFDFARERLADNVFCVGRIARNVRTRSRVITLSARVVPNEATASSFRWVILQGDPQKIQIQPLDEKASRVRITVEDHGAFRPLDRNGQPKPFRTSRVDIGCFAQGTYHASLPSLYCIYYLPSESRVYREDGQILSVDYTNPSHAYADPILTMQKSWKDIYSYTENGKCLGWTRTNGVKNEHFTYAGHRVLERDAKGRPVRACSVDYIPRSNGTPNIPPFLSYADGGKKFVYRYADEKDVFGTIQE